MMNRLNWAMSGVIGLGIAAGPSFGASIIEFGPDVDASLFRVTKFAENVSFPTSMREAGPGALLVGTTVQEDGGDGGNFYSDSAVGQLLLLQDLDADGVAESQTVVASGLTGAVSSVRRAGDLVLATSTYGNDSYIHVLRPDSDDPTKGYASLGSLRLAFPDSQHKSYALAVRAVDGKHEVFFNVGSAEDGQASAPDSVTLSGTGVYSGSTELNADSIYRVTLDDAGDTPTFSGPEQIASGLRNAAGIAFDPETGDLWFQDNGIDGNGDDVAKSADELNRIPQNRIGGDVDDFGFPDTYVPYDTDSSDDSGDGSNHEVAFLPRDGEGKAEGASEIAFAPAGFPTPYSNGVFIGFHGEFTATGTDNEENPVVFYDLAKETFHHFISNEDGDISHPNGLLATEDALFVADMGKLEFSKSNPDGYGYGTGTIYRITAAEAVPSPAALWVGVMGFGLLAIRRPCSRRF